MRRLVEALPILRWLPGYQRSWLRLDFLAGTTLAAYAVPNAVAYALLAGLAPVAGLAGYLFGGLVYAVLGTSRRLAFGPTSAISLVVATTLAPLAGGDAQRFAALAGASALLVGALALAAWALRSGGIAHFISRPVLTGYKFGAALVIALSQLPSLLGISPGGHDTFSRAAHLVRHLGEAQPWVFGVGLSAWFLLELGQRLAPRLPMGLLVVLLCMGAAAFAGLEAHGVPVVGSVPQGLPQLSLPSVNLRDIRELLPLALACFLLAYLEGTATARALATDERVDANQELLALGVANAVLGVAHGYPAGGGLGQSAVNSRGGARTPLSLVVTSGWMAIILLYLVGTFSHLPRAALAALVLASVTSLLDVKELVRLTRMSPSATAVALVSIAGVLYLGILQGVLLAALLSLAVILRDEASLSVSQLGALANAAHYADLARHPAAVCQPDTLVLRINGPLFYFNTETVELRILEFVQAAAPGLRRVIIDVSFTQDLDISGGDMLHRLQLELSARSVTLWLADVHYPTRVALHRQGLGDLLADSTRRLTVSETLQALDHRARVVSPC